MSAPYRHVLLLCRALDEERGELLTCCQFDSGLSTASKLTRLLCLMPGEWGFLEATRFACLVDQQCVKFWREVG